MVPEQQTARRKTQQKYLRIIYLFMQDHKYQLMEKNWKKLEKIPKPSTLEL